MTPSGVLFRLQQYSADGHIENCRLWLKSRDVLAWKAINFPVFQFGIFVLLYLFFNERNCGVSEICTRAVTVTFRNIYWAPKKFQNSTPSTQYVAASTELTGQLLNAPLLLALQCLIFPKKDECFKRPECWSKRSIERFSGTFKPYILLLFK